MFNLRNVIWLLIAVCWVSFDPRTLRCEEPLAIDDIMWKDPPYTEPSLKYDFPPQLPSLWSKAFQNPDSELQRSAADTVAIAQRRGVGGLGELTNHLVAILKAKDQESSVRRAAAHALVVLEAREHAQVLAQAAEHDGLDVAQFVEPALAKWGYTPIQKTWLQRLEDPSVRPLWLLLAIRCVGDTKQTAARAPLLNIVHDRRAAPTTRLAAARSLATVHSDQLVGEAEKRIGDTQATVVDRILAATLVSRHSDAEAVALMKQLATDSEPSVAALSLGRLLAIDPALVFEHAPQAIKNQDVNVRRIGAEALIVKADADAIRQLTALLDDPNPTLRSRVAQSFVDLGTNLELREAVIGEIERALTLEGWRGLEKAILLAVRFERKNTAERMFELLRNRRKEVAVTAAWALRRFALRETLPKMLEYAQSKYDVIAKLQTPGHELAIIEDQHSQLFQAFGQLRYKEAEPLMRKFVPKNFALGMDSRCGAIWALGHLNEDKPPKDLANQLVERLSDIDSMMPEVTTVRAVCAVSLGRMNAQDHVAVLKRFAEADGITTLVGQSCWWSLEKMTDEKRPPIPVITQTLLGWFLQPVDAGR